MKDKKRLSIKESEIKILFAKSGNQCAFPDCNESIIRNEDQDKPIGEMAHIIAYNDNGPRSDPLLSDEERNSASNLILLCPTHHSIVDKFEFQYNVNVLREMKASHEKKYSSPINSSITITSSSNKEKLYLSMLAINILPRYIFKANTIYTYNNIFDLFDKLNYDKSEDNLAFELRNKKIYTFHNLLRVDNPFRGVYDTNTVEQIDSATYISQPEYKILYISLLNRCLKNQLRKQGIAYDKNFRRFYFMPDKNVIERKIEYKSLSNKKSMRSVVHNPITKMTGLVKNYWIHLASKIEFHQVASSQWVLTIRPERHLTTDGYTHFPKDKVGQKVTRIKSTVYNWQYLQEIHFWKELLINNSPRLIITTGDQSIVIENELLSSEINWPGVLDDEKDYSAKPPEEDLFSYAEFDQILSANDDDNNLDNKTFVYDKQ